MRILMAVPKYPLPIMGGLEGQAHELAKALIRRGHVVHALSSRFAAQHADFELIDGVQVHRVNWFESKSAPLALAQRLLKLKPSVDLVHVHNLSWFGGIITLVAKTLRLPVLTKLPNVGEFGIPGIKRRRLSRLRIALLKQSDAMVAMTPESLAELNRIGYRNDKVLKAVNGIVPLPPAPRTHRTTVKLVFVGRLAPEKGLIDLLHVWALVRAQRGVAVKLRLVGDGPQSQELRALAARLELGAALEFAGYSSDVPGELASADVFVLPSYAEGNSNAILEAMRAGLPIVATDVGGAAIQVGREGKRFLVAPGDCQSLAARLLELIDNQALRLEVGQAMRTRIERSFTMERVAAIYEQAFDLIVGGRAEQVCSLNPGIFSLS